MATMVSTTTTQRQKITTTTTKQTTASTNTHNKIENFHQGLTPTGQESQINNQQTSRGFNKKGPNYTTFTNCSQKNELL